MAKEHKRIGSGIMTKKFIALLLIFILTFILASCSSDKQKDESSTATDNSLQDSNDKIPLPQSDDNNKGTETEDKILIAYFTRTNNTKKVAQQIYERVGGDLVQIVTVNAYPEDYNECTAQASKELEEDFRPELQTLIENMDDYDVIYLGYPNWWGTIPMPIATFLESYNFSEKTIIPFCTHGSSRLGRSEAHIAELAPQAILREGLAIEGSSVDSAQSEVEAWLKGLGAIN